MLYVLYVGLAITTFLVLVNGFLNGRLKQRIDAICGLTLVGQLAAIVLWQGWRVGIVALAAAFLGAIFLRPLAARTAARLRQLGE